MAIGVFDSGIGGLTVLHALARRLPNADIVYLADQAMTPYGGRPGEEIVDLTRAGCVRLFEAGCDLVVLACNTAAAVALRRLRDDPTTLEELASQYGVSRERVRQIEVRAFEKLQKAMRAAATERHLDAA